jgi:transglutaminase-like putative cysteine protease
MRVTLSHVTQLEYSTEVMDGVMDVRLGPLSDEHQRWSRFELQASPNASVNRYVDGFGNAAHLITMRKPHHVLEVTSRAEVDTLMTNPFAPPVEAPRPLSPAERVDYVLPSPLVPRDADIEGMAEPFRPRAAAEVFDATQRFMDLVYREITYEPLVTGISTTVSDVLAARRGVCQDFAHVLIALCRAIEVPTRYVSGYVVSAQQQQSQRLGSMSQSQSQTHGPRRGTDASHAWVEAFVPTHGWRGLDPTNNLVASEYHVKMAIGRDYADVSPTRGAYRGGADERLSVTVSAHPQS